MVAGKWITDLSPAASFVDAARHVLTIRLETVRHFLDSTPAQIDNDPERVHQLRVGTRRAGAALDVFGDCLARPAARKARRFLKKIRRAAGDVRDWDVFLIGLDRWRDTKKRGLTPALDLLRGLALTRRDAARTELLEACSDQPFAFERLLTKVLNSVNQPHRGTAVHLGDVAVPFLLERIGNLGQSAGTAGDDGALLHRVRILGKRLRYGMEIFGDCFDSEFKDRLYPLVEQMQECLGLVHDSDAAAGHLQKWRERAEMTFPKDWPRYRPGFAVLIESHQKVVATESEKFWTCWRRWIEAAPATRLASLQVAVQRGEFVSIDGKDKLTPGEPPPAEESGLPVTEPVGET
jgi:CHAD domain-containing protein